MSDLKPGEKQSDPLFFNKIAGAGLAALLLIFGLPQLAGGILGGGGHHGGGEDEELHLAYCCVELETGGGETKPEEVYDLGRLLANASVSAGERGAGLCKSCHNFDKGGPNGAGPNLYGVVGRSVASHAGFNYTSALSDAGGEWTYERLDHFLKNSQEYVPGTAMAQRIGKDEKRADLLAYLGSLSDNPVPYPAPLPADAASADEGEAAPAEGEGEGAGDAAEAAPAQEAMTEAGENGGLLDAAAQAAGNVVDAAGEAADTATDAVENAVDGERE